MALCVIFRYNALQRLGIGLSYHVGLTMLLHLAKPDNLHNIFKSHGANGSVNTTTFLPDSRLGSALARRGLQSVPHDSTNRFYHDQPLGRPPDIGAALRTFSRVKAISKG